MKILWVVKNHRLKNTIIIVYQMGSFFSLPIPSCGRDVRRIFTYLARKQRQYVSRALKWFIDFGPEISLPLAYIIR